MAKTKPGHRGEFAAPKGRIVAELDGEPRPKGRAPGNDTGTPLVWSYVRGKWVDVSKGGMHKGEKMSEAEREVTLPLGRTLTPTPALPLPLT